MVNLSGCLQTDRLRRVKIPVSSVGLSASTTMSTSDQADLLKLSREQLKRLCKECGHTGYSKCTKPQLVALLGSSTPSKFNSSMMATALPHKQDASSSASVPKKRLESGSSGPGESVAKKQKLSNPTSSKNSPSTLSSTVPAPPKAKRKPRFTQKPPVIREPSIPHIFTTPAAISLLDQQPNPPPVPQLPTSSASNHSLSLPQPQELSTRSQTTLISQPQNRAVDKQESGTSFPATGSIQRPTSGNGRTQVFKKFLDPRNGVKSSHLVSYGPQETLPVTIVAPSSTASVKLLSPPYLDFSVLPVPVLGLIGMPPSISDRKKVYSWSIILSGVSDIERRACILVSRMFRYAGKPTLRSLSLGYLISVL